MCLFKLFLMYYIPLDGKLLGNFGGFLRITVAEGEVFYCYHPYGFYSFPLKICNEGYSKSSK